MDDQAIDLTNITVNDQSASAYVEGKRGVAFQRDRAVSIKEIRKNIYQSVPKSRPEDPAFQGKVAKRVRYLTDEEIRREKGVLAKPFKTQAENLIYILTSKAPITTAEAAKELGMKIENVQGLMSKVTLRLGEAIKRERKGLQFVYMPADPAMTHQQLYAEYLNGSPAKMAKAESIKKAEEDLAKLPELPPEIEAAAGPTILPALAAASAAPKEGQTNGAAIPSISIPSDIRLHVKVEISFKVS